MRFRLRFHPGNCRIMLRPLLLTEPENDVVGCVNFTLTFGIIGFWHVSRDEVR